MEPARSNYRLTEKDKRAYEAQILDALQNFPSENDLEVTAVALRAFSQNPAVVPERCPENLKQKLQEISTFYNNPSEAYIADTDDYPLYQEIVRNALQTKANFVEKLTQRPEEKKSYFESQRAHLETKRQNREFLREKAKKLFDAGKSQSSVETHDTGEREYEIANNQEIRGRLDSLRQLGATEDDLLCMPPEIWNLLVEQEGDSLINCQSYVENRIFSLQELISSKVPLALAIFSYPYQVQTLLSQGMQKEDLLELSGEVLETLFIEKLEHEILQALDRFKNEKELFFSMHPQAQLQAILTKEDPEDKDSFLKSLDKKVIIESVLYYFSVLKEQGKDPLPLEALALFQKALPQQELQKRFLISFFSEEEGWNRWVDIEKSMLFLLGFSKDSEENMLRIVGDQDLALWLLHVQESLEPVLERSSLTIRDFLSIKRPEERSFFLKYCENTAAILANLQLINNRYLLENFRSDVDPERQRWVVSCWQTLEPLVEMGVPLQRLLFDQAFPLDVLQGFCLHGKAVSELLQKGLELDFLIGFPDRDLIQKLLENSEAVAHLLSVFQVDWQMFSQNPYAFLLIQNAKALEPLSLEEFGSVLSALTYAQNPQHLLRYAENVPKLLMQRDRLRALDLSAEEILLSASPFYEQILKKPQESIELISLRLIPVNVLQTLSQAEAEALFTAPGALLELNQHLPLLKIFSALRGGGDPSVALLILKKAQEAIALSTSTSYNLEWLLNSGNLRIAEFYLENQEELSLLHGNEVDIGTLSNELGQLVYEVKNGLHSLKGKDLLISTFSISEEAFSEELEDSSVMMLASQKAKEIVTILEMSPLLKIEELLSYIKTHREEMGRIFTQAEGVWCLLSEGVDIEILFSLSDEEFQRRCKDACLRLKKSR